jgi:hypothetical protein
MACELYGVCALAWSTCYALVFFADLPRVINNCVEFWFDSAQLKNGLDSDGNRLALKSPVTAKFLRPRQ